MEDALTHSGENKRKIADTGKISELFGQLDKAFDAHAMTLEELYINRTMVEGYNFAKKVLEELINSLDEMKGHVDRCGNTLGEALRHFQRAIDSRCNDGEINLKQQPDLKQQLVRFYDSGRVKSVTNAFAKDSAEQKTQTATARNKIIDKMGDNHTFSTVNQRIQFPTLVDILEETCYENALIAHNKIRDGKDKFIGVSIIEKLRERYDGNDQELKTFITNLVKHAGNYFPFMQQEVLRSAPGIPRDVQICVNTFTVIMPRSTEHAEFVKQLSDMFRGSRIGNTEIIYSDAKPNEITLVGITNLFPLRVGEIVGYLSEKYEQRISAANSSRATLEIHIEGDGTRHPSLFVPTSGDIQEKFLPYLLLAKVIDFIQTGKNPSNGSKELMIITRDDEGFENEPVFLGKSLTDAIHKLDIVNSGMIKGGVLKLLKTNDNSSDANKEKLREKILQQVALIKTERDNNATDPIYRQFNDAGKKAFKILKGEE
ncbi:MAG: hypothetical protein HQK89_02605 [Nitrospirae bacterium]|nr:hypothetical protein [Nitrospirota bacterium]